MEPAPAALNGSAPLPAPLRELCARERMAVARVEEVTRLECRGDARRRPATWGVYHGDFAPENLVVDARGLRCVDNTTVGLHLLEVDAGFTFNRWPLSGALREAFLRGYRRRADPEPFLGCEPFWRISAALRSAAYRIREGTGGVDLPLAEVDRLVA